MEKQSKKQKQQYDFLRFVVFTDETHYKFIIQFNTRSKKKSVSKKIRKALKHGEHFFGTEENNKKLQIQKELTEQEELKKKMKIEKLKEEARLLHESLQYPKNEKKDDDKRQPSFCQVKGCTLTLVDGKYCCQPCNYVCDDYIKGRLPTCSCENIRPVVYELNDVRQNTTFDCSTHGNRGGKRDLRDLKAECKECGWFCCKFCFEIKKTKAQSDFLAVIYAQEKAFYNGAFTYNKDAALPEKGKYVEGQGCGATISAGQQFWRYAFCEWRHSWYGGCDEYTGNFLMESKALSDIKCGPKYASDYVKVLNQKGEFQHEGSEQFICMKCVEAQGMKQFKSIYEYDK